MNRLRYLLFMVLISNSLKSQYLWQFYSDTIIKWNYYDGDEFNTGVVNTNRWKIGFPWSRAILSQETMVRDSNITFSKGIVAFTLKKEKAINVLETWQIDTIDLKKKGVKIIDGNKWESKFSGSLLWSNKPYKYGYFEIKFKAPEGQGIWPAFWLYGAKPNNEIDFFELKGEKEKNLHVDVHCPDGCGNFKEGPFGYRKSWGHWVNTDKKLKSGFNLLAGEWTAGFIKWYLNGELIAYCNHSFDLAMNLIVGTGIAKDGAAFKPGPNKATPFPNSFYVDYVRVYISDTLPNYKEIESNLASGTDTMDNSNSFLARKTKKRLKNNPDPKIKKTEVLTISVTQITKNTLSLRVMGYNKNDKVQVSFKDMENLLREIECKGNIEELIFLNGNKTVNMSIKVNNKIVNENITLQ